MAIPEQADAAAKYLRKIEFSMGNGQCPDCEGVDPQRGWYTDLAGHRPGCSLGLALEDVGVEVFWEQANPTIDTRRASALKKLDAFLAERLEESVLKVWAPHLVRGTA